MMNQDEESSDLTTSLTAEGITLLGLVGLFLEKWKLVVAGPFLGVVLAGVVYLTLPKEYTTIFTFTPGISSARNPGGALSLLAGQLGVSAGETASGPDFYARLLKSRYVLQEVARSRYTFTDPASGERETVNLADLFAVDHEDEARRIEGIRAELQDRIGVSVEVITGLLTVRVTAPHRQLTRAVADTLIGILNRTNMTIRQAHAREVREFIESRMLAAGEALETAEDTLAAFIRRNAQRESPLLQIEQDRLARQVTISQQLFMELRSQYEDARIQEVNDVPVLTYIDLPFVPLKASAPKRNMILLLGFLLGSVAAVAMIITGTALNEAHRTGRADFRQIRQGWSTVAGDFRRIFRR